MLNERFLGRLEAAFPEFHAKVSAEALEDAVRLQRGAGNDLQKALIRARIESAGRVWWPYVRGMVPIAKNERLAMEAFSRLVLTVDHLVGHPPPTMEEARSHVTQVLRQSLDVERLQRLVKRETPEEAKAAAAGTAAGAGLVASMTALVSPITTFRSLRKYARFVPPPLRVTLAAVVVAAILSIPLVAGYSAGLQAENAARQDRLSLASDAGGGSKPKGPARSI